jgi:hypothetical protein
MQKGRPWRGGASHGVPARDVAAQRDCVSKAIGSFNVLEHAGSNLRLSSCSTLVAAG